MKSKDAKRRQQLKAQEKKRRQAEKQKAKKLARKPSAAGASAIAAVIERWMKLGPGGMPVEQPCPGCSGRIGAEADGDALVFLHTEPHCAAYEAFGASVDESNAEEDGISLDEVMARMLPPWAHGPSTELTEEQGDELLDSDDVLESCQVMSSMMTASIHALTKDGLFHWSVTVPVIDDEDEEDEDEISEVTAKVD